MGVSGSGKTTLMNIVGLLDKQAEGEYKFMDVTINGLMMRNLPP